MARKRGGRGGRGGGGGRGRGRGRGRGDFSGPTPPRQPFNQQFSSHPFAQASAPRSTLAEEARWTSSHRSHAFEPGKQLRNLKIEFVSSGYLEGTIKQEKKEEETPVMESPNNTPTMADLSIRSASPSPSNSSSSEDEVVFRGRGTTSFTQASTTSSLPIRGVPAVSKASAPSTTTLDLPRITPSASSRPTASPTRKTLPAQSPIPDSAPAGSSQGLTPIVTAESDPDSGVDELNEEQFRRRLNGKSVWETNTPEWEHRSKPGIGWLPGRERPPMDTFLRGDVNPQDAAMDDYMQNIEDFGTREELLAFATQGFARREMSLEAGDHNDWESDMSEVQKQEDGWNADILHDLDGLSTSSDVMDIVERVVSKRVRKTGVQYLVVYEGSTQDDVHWIPASHLKTKSDLELIRAFEAESASGDRRVGSSSEDTDNSEDDSEDTDEEMEELDDAQIARILQKQEELGLPADEILLYGGDAAFADHVVDFIEPSSRGFDRSNKRRQNRARGSGRYSEPSFPSATLMADILDMDPYNGFDIMDTERPSLRPRKKGRRGQMPAELEDSDLYEQLQASWETDRATKRVKKAEREELRKQGLLGRKGKGPDLSVKFNGGFDLNEIKEEIRDFLDSDIQTLALPPMEARWRAVIHKKVNKLGLNSKSRGDGARRFTVLSKTSRTWGYDEETFDVVFDEKKFTRGQQRSLQRGAFRSGPSTRANVGYKDGDTVGASAPELGQENKGHALMEKMGWKKGMALGALDNKGILQPIAHIVKTSKLGLQ
ncbi:hypothetical protein K504DRAFT_462904 [Pleomassaria siparia CBS 279.74]|uniref:Protein SQS1 n=1 Tax=Pleomassaria siparia CBS 279.74 TaxID=1314801 RepID=A0A6G1JW03_9PLEO|nr:hypothetical protein K504DRAFT_462904 [Pleomassaria siparia CBS 279.74]